MATMIQLPREEFFSESYLDSFYRAHVATRTRSNLNIDDDIAAIEAEIRKVKSYQSKFRNYKQLNSCGNSECSDVDDLENTSPTSSVFKVYNSASTKYPPSSCGEMSPPSFFHRGPDIFTWAVAQQVAHDHTYCKPSTLPQETHIDHGAIVMKNVQWHHLSMAKRAQAVHKLSCILQHRPSGRHSPTFSSIDLLPSSLANCIRKTGTLGLNGSSKKFSPPDTISGRQVATIDRERGGGSETTVEHSVKHGTCIQQPSSTTAAHLPMGVESAVSKPATLSPILPHHLPSSTRPPVVVPLRTSSNMIGIKEIKSKQRTYQCVPTTPTNPTMKDIGGGPMTRSSSRKRTRPSPYDRLSQSTRTSRSMEVTRVRNISSCSEEGEDPVVID